MIKIKKFAGPNIAKSLALAKQEMGDDALILQTMRRRKGAEHVVEIVAANDQAAKMAGNLVPPALGAVTEAGAACGQALGELAGDAAAGSGEKATEVLGGLDLGVVRELGQIEAQLKRIMAKIAPPEWDDRRKHLNRLRVNLQNAGFDPGLVQRTFLRREPAEGGSFDKYLSDLIGDVPLEVPEERVSIFVGPSGSGKTTALLKVAAAVLLRRGIVPRVMYFGDKRAGDPRVLKSSCRRLGIKFKAVSDGSRLAAEVAKGNGEPVLIDTPGIAELGDDGLKVLAGLTRNAEGAVIRLVVNSAMDAANISAIASCIPAPARVSLVLTKLDEATRIGGAVSAAIREGIPVGYLTGGRDFGSGIYVPDRGLLYDRIVEGLARSVTGAN